ncbi:MAG: hypothetical protein K0S37_1061 [Microbacterium sp.]|nr:hypothetical protein [Microbacterium sp.]
MSARRRQRLCCHPATLMDPRYRPVTSPGGPPARAGARYGDGMTPPPVSPRRPADVVGIVAVVLATVVILPSLFVFLVGPT